MQSEVHDLTGPRGLRLTPGVTRANGSGPGEVGGRGAGCVMEERSFAILTDASL
uniref:Uncharacterized protein n=1 Tax=Anguilla anguilla TaxID=7936 RepID=A0A0E9PUN7_ANGAN